MKTINGTLNKTARQSIVDDMVSQYNEANENVITEFDVLIKSDKAKTVLVNGTPKKILMKHENNKNNNESNYYLQLKSYPKEILNGDFVTEKSDDPNEVNRTYLVTSVPQLERDCDVNYVALCNQTLNYKGLSKPIPCYATNSSYGTKGVVDLNQITVFEAKILFYTQWNKDTAKIRQDMRFIFNNDKYSVYQVVDIGRVTTGNVLRLVMNKVEYIESKDDLENNIAYNDFLEGNTPTPPPINPDTYNIKPSSGDFTINKYGSKTFTICDGSGVPSTDTWNVELIYNNVPTNHIEVVSKTSNSIRIKNILGACDSVPKIKFTKGNITIEAEVRLIR